MKLLLVLLVLFSTAACEPLDQTPMLYQAQTPNCDNWLDGSSDAYVFASSPKLINAETLELGLAYFVPRGSELTFSNQAFLIRQPKDANAQEGAVARVDVGPNESGKHKVLLSLPRTLHSSPEYDETVFRVKLHFKMPVPARFDLTPPRMLIEGSSYPVRTYTYRFFEERGVYGLCS